MGKKHIQGKTKRKTSEERERAKHERGRISGRTRPVGKAVRGSGRSDKNTNKRSGRKAEVGAGRKKKGRKG